MKTKKTNRDKSSIQMLPSVGSPEPAFAKEVLEKLLTNEVIHASKMFSNKKVKR